MTRAARVVAAVLACLILSAWAFSADVTIAPGPRWYRPIPIPLSDKPVEQLKAQPKYVGTPLYGAIHLGNGKDNTYTVVVDLAPDWSAFSEAFKAAEGKVDMNTVPARIYVDGDNDQDLTNDGDGVMGFCSSDRAAPGAFIVGVDAKCQVTYADKHRLEYPIGFWMFPQRPKAKQPNGTEQDYAKTLFYRRDCSFETKLTIKGTEVSAAFYDENADGLVTPKSGDLVAIDLNQDGQLDPNMKGPEIYDLVTPFNFRGGSYRLKSWGPRGNGAVVTVSKQKVPPPVYIAVGQPPPDFSHETLDGGKFTLSEQKGKVVLIDFWATWCGPCRGEVPNVVKMWNEVKDKGFVIVGVSLDADDKEGKAADKVRKFAEENGMTWTHIVEGKSWDSETGKLYLVEGIPHTVLVGKDGKIIALDLRGEELAQKVKEALGQ